jgi:magnesium transporter
VGAGATWIDLLDPNEEELRQRAPRELHPRARDQLLEPARHEDEPRPTLEGHGAYVFGVLLVAVAVPAEDRVFYQEIDVVLTEDTILTVRKTPPGDPPFDPTTTKEACPEEAEVPAGMILYHLVDEVAEAYLDLLDALNDEIDELEDHVEDWPTRKIRQRLSDFRHDLLHIRRTLNPTRDAVHKIVDDRVELEPGELFPRQVELHFADAYDKLLRVHEGLELSRDLISGVRDYHQAKVANEQNEVMKRLTVIASLLLVPTFIVGVYGQNFDHIPELGWSFGYWWSWAWIALTTVAQLAFFRWRKWI